MPAPNPHELVLSYTRVRTALGLLGMALPVFLIFGVLAQRGDGLEPSISDFYHTLYRDLFVGTMIAIGVFLISYRGYAPVRRETFTDDLLATLAGIGAFGTALFPNEIPVSVTQTFISQDVPPIYRDVPPATFTQGLFGVRGSQLFHYVFATLFFGCLAAFCFAKFARYARKPWRRRTYLFCGWTIVGVMVAAFVASMLKNFGPPEHAAVAFVKDTPFIFWLEAIGIWAFGLSWLVKGKADYPVAAAAVRMRNIVRPR